MIQKDHHFRAEEWNHSPLPMSSGDVTTEAAHKLLIDDGCLVSIANRFSAGGCALQFQQERHVDLEAAG